MTSMARPPKAAGLALGVGLGGFVDGIVLHQILQWHHMVSSTESNPATTLAGLERNTLADGLFHAVTFLAVVVGIALLWRWSAQPTTRPPSRGLLAWVLVGWGAFNLADGVVNHHLLGLHHVREDVEAVLVWDLAFLAVAAVQVLVGLGLARRADVVDVRSTRTSITADPERRTPR
jgi:uncharacterized membrane protein